MRRGNARDVPMVPMTDAVPSSRSPVSRTARIWIAMTAAVAAVLLWWWYAGYDARLGVVICVPAGLAVVTGVAAVPGAFGKLRDAGWVFAAMLPVNALAAVFLAGLLANDFQRRENGTVLAVFALVNVVAAGVLGVAVAGPGRWRPGARRAGMLAAALGCAAAVLGTLLAIVSALS